MNIQQNVNRQAPLKNVAAFSTLLQRVVERPLSLPGMACFYGPSGYGKTKSAVYGANKYQALYVECDQFTTAKSLIIMILQELGIAKPKGTITSLISEAVMLLSSDISKPLIIDEAHNIAHKKFIDIARTLHDKSLAPVILIGEETLPKELEAFERVHNRMLEWCQAVPCDEDDFRLLCAHSCPDLKIADDLAASILQHTRGNTRRIVINLHKANEKAKLSNLDSIDLAKFGGVGAISDGRAPMPRVGR